MLEQHNAPPSPGFRRGFSVIEVMVALAVLAIVTMLSVPNFRNFVQNNNITASANNLMSSLSLARSEAVKRNVQVTVCASSTQTDCTGLDWDNGWIVFTDLGVEGMVDGDDEIISAVKGLPGGMELSASTPFIQFKPNGSLATCVHCLWDSGINPVASMLHTIQNWATGLLYHLLPGNDVIAAQDQSRHQHQYQYGRKKDGSGTKGGAGTVPNFAGVEYVFCDASQEGETGKRIVVSLSGQITLSSYQCN